MADFHQTGVDHAPSTASAGRGLDRLERRAARARARHPPHRPRPALPPRRAARRARSRGPDRRR
ncbi:MAG: hypothetical protein MZW92_53145 [Comamonadaceae bacterium]|nr:hypothetical protein [Comamonadaceae bacterium]